MNKLVDKIKYNILYNKIEYPLLHVVKQKDYSFFKTKEIIFEQRDVISFEDFNLGSKKYNTIVLEDIESIPLEIFRVLNNDGVVYFFVNNEENLIDDLYRYFKFVNTNVFKLNFEFIPESRKELVHLSSNNDKSIKLVSASNYNPIVFDTTTSISVDYLNSYLERFFVSNELFISNSNELKSIKEDFIKCIRRDDILSQKQKVIKSTINNLLIKDKQNSEIINKNRSKLYNYENYINILLTKLEDKEYLDFSNQIDMIERLINYNIDSIENYIALNKNFLKSKSEEPRNSFTLEIKTSSKNINEIKKLYEEHNEFVIQNNQYVSEISHLKFDIKETIEEKKELILTIKELEKQINELESKKDIYFNGVLNDFKEKSEEEIVSLKEINKKLYKEIDNLNLTIKKIEDKNKKNILILDEKTVLIQKLNAKIDALKEEIDLKENLVNKKNLIIKDKDNSINLLEDSIVNKDKLYNNLKKEFEESTEKMNSNYYKELYDNLEKEYKKLKRKYRESINTNQEYKSEIEQYEIKIQELIGYNERITKDIDIDIDDF
jgi:hypothetical protein